MSRKLPYDAEYHGYIITDLILDVGYTREIRGGETVSFKIDYVKKEIIAFETSIGSGPAVLVGRIPHSVTSVLLPQLEDGFFFLEEGTLEIGSHGKQNQIICRVHTYGRPADVNSQEFAMDCMGVRFIRGNHAALTVSLSLSEDVAVKPVEPPGVVIRSQLSLYQKECLGWLLHRENSSELPRFWEKKEYERFEFFEKKEYELFENVLTNYRTTKIQEPSRGGILVDDMEVCQIPTLISLVSFDRYGSGLSFVVKEKRSVEYDILLSVCEMIVTEELGRSCCCSPSFENVMQKTPKFWSKTTLVVSPSSSRCSSWMAQLKENTIPGSLKGYIYPGGSTDKVEELSQFDIVMTTYEILAAKSDSPLNEMNWWRVIFDEAHMIKNTDAQQSQAIINLNAKCRWAVTGTQLQNDSLGIFYLMGFLQFEPFPFESHCRSLVQIVANEIAFNKEIVTELACLQVHMATMSLRKAKDKGLIGLPFKINGTCPVDLKAEGNQFYEQFKELAKNVFRKFMDESSLEHKYSTVGLVNPGGHFCCSVFSTEALFVDFFMSVITKKHLADSWFEKKRVLMASIRLRRTKDEGVIGLPLKIFGTCRVELSVEENKLYQQFEGLAKNVFQTILNENSMDEICPELNNSTVLSILLHLRQICASTALLPPALRSLLPSSSMKDVVSALEEFDCPLCMCNRGDMVITCCQHKFCRVCIVKALHEKPCCPFCRNSISKSDISLALPDDSSSPLGTVSSKANMLLSLLQESRDKNQSMKSIVFSEMSKILILLKKPLEAAGFKVWTINDAGKSAEVIIEFGLPRAEPSVLLASLFEAHVDLTAASNVYIFEPYWSPAVEERAINLVHQSGQKEDVRIISLFVFNSIEEKILKLREKEAGR